MIKIFRINSQYAGLQQKNTQIKNIVFHYYFWRNFDKRIIKLCNYKKFATCEHEKYIRDEKLLI